jgi:hypothetical protein
LFLRVHNIFALPIAIFPDVGSFFICIILHSFILSCGGKKTFTVGSSLEDYDDDDDDDEIYLCVVHRTSEWY